MGTRNLTKVINSDGVTVVAQYGQWDGYPSGQGVNALWHVHNNEMIEKGLSKCHFLSEQECENINSIISASNKPMNELYPTLSRDTGADILGYIAFATDKVPLVDNSDFENDELFCEGVYTFDYQKRKFISWYGGKTVEFNLDFPPTMEQYLDAWKE